VHPQHWPEDLDYAGKKVVVIGSGATAVTLVPAMAETAEHVTMLQRSPSYIASVPSKNPLTALGRRGGSSRFARSVVRWALAVLGVVSYRFSRKHPDTIRKFIRKGQEKALPAGYDIDTHFTPTYQPWDQRMCMVPDGDLFEAINDGRASVVTDHIDTFTSSGIRLESGTELDADIIVSATGLSMLFLGGIELVVDGEKVDPGKRLTYKGMMLQDVPNLAFAIGYTNASWTLKCELTSDYVARLLTRLHETGMRQCTPTGPMDGAEPQPLLPLSSGYVQRAVDAFPKQGEAFPWQVHQNYLKDYRAMRLSNVDDDVMSFSNPIPIRTRDTAPAPEPAVAGADR
jgi:cation diffusion facilitator CzcD-associated flavoprotein CzcO